MRRLRTLLWELPLLILCFAAVFLLTRGFRRDTVVMERMEDQFARIAQSPATVQIGNGGILPTLEIAPARSPDGSWDIHLVLDKATLLGATASSGSRLQGRVLLFLDGVALADTDVSPVSVPHIAPGDHVFAAILTDAHRKAFASGSQLVTRILVGTVDDNGFRMTEKR